MLQAAVHMLPVFDYASDVQKARFLQPFCHFLCHILAVVIGRNHFLAEIGRPFDILGHALVDVVDRIGAQKAHQQIATWFQQLKDIVKCLSEIHTFFSLVRSKELSVYNRGVPDRLLCVFMQLFLCQIYLYSVAQKSVKSVNQLINGVWASILTKLSLSVIFFDQKTACPKTEKCPHSTQSFVF